MINQNTNKTLNIQLKTKCSILYKIIKEWKTVYESMSKGMRNNW